jgi:hypothetical protein
MFRSDFPFRFALFLFRFGEPMISTSRQMIEELLRASRTGITTADIAARTGLRVQNIKKHLRTIDHVVVRGGWTMRHALPQYEQDARDEMERMFKPKKKKPVRHYDWPKEIDRASARPVITSVWDLARHV